MNQGPITISQLYSAHQGKISDKWTRYLAEYDSLFSEIQDKPIRLLEIGIQNGGGLEIWANFFENGQKFIGCDINPDCSALRFDDSRIALVIGDATTNATQNEILLQSPELDVVIEDGSHHSGDVIRAFLKYFPNIVDGGIFVAEDLHTSYWQEYEGGLFDPYSSITFFKRLVDIINSEHWGVVRNTADVLKGFEERYKVDVDVEMLEHIHSITFVNSLCIIRKCQPSQNKIGSRFIAGALAGVSTEMVDLHGTPLVPPPQSENPWATRVRPPDEELIDREQELEEMKQRTVRTEDELLMLKDKVNEIYKSRTWRMVQFIWRIRTKFIPTKKS